MVYPGNFEEKTGFSYIRALVGEKCISRLGRQWCDDMQFSSDYETVRKWLLQTDEMVAALGSSSDLPVHSIYDVSDHIRRLSVNGSYLEAEVLRHLRSTLATADSVASFFRKTSEESSSYVYPNLNEALAPLQSFPEVIRSIDNILTDHGTIRDTASPQLASIRRSLQSVSASMSGIMRRVIDRSASQGVLTRDVTPTVRDGRLVVPVPAMLKRRLDGIVHDESATGKTVFIEPAEVVEANNRLRELQAEERREIIRILVELADTLRPKADDMLATMNILGLFEFIRAKALVAVQFGGSMPTMDRKPHIEWYHAVHPVLAATLEAQGREVVPLDITLDSRRRILVISGPNAGGKSVTLKTVGIVQYMLQCGLLPTLYSNSHVSVFSDILLDIGDEQSIENDLSTYSSHLRNMKSFLNAASSSSLILIDEMGSGTEPHFGGALAQSILERLNEMKVMGIVTTHYQNLKSFADTTDGVVNGAMLYDRQKMRPLFQLSIGSPGSSFALEIARNTGLPADVIEKAKEIVGSDYVDSDKYMLDIARDRRYWANKRLSIKEKEHKLDQILESYENTAGDLRRRKAEILADARRQAADILRNSNAVLEKTILEIRKSQAEKERTKELRQELEEYKKSVADTSEDASIQSLKTVKRPKNRQKGKEQISGDVKAKVVKETELAVGSNVKMADSNTVGTIIAIDGAKATVAFGALRTIVPLDRLRPTSQKALQNPVSQFAGGMKTSSVSDVSRSHQLSFSRELDVRGMRVDEALQAVTYFLDDALQFSADRVRILHGTGTGALRASIRQLLQTNPAVAQFHDEDVRFGGAGITVVVMA